MMADVIEEHEEGLAREDPDRKDAFFEEVVAWLEYLEDREAVKPSTLSGTTSSSRGPKDATRGSGEGGIMGAFGRTAALRDRVPDVRAFLALLDREDLGHERSTSTARSSLGFSSSPAAKTASGSPTIRSQRPKASRRRPEAGRDLRARGNPRGRRAARGRTPPPAPAIADRFSEETGRERRRINEQDAALFTIAACTGLRLGELGHSAGATSTSGRFPIGLARVLRREETSTKSRRSRTVPLADQPRRVQASAEPPRFTVARTSSSAGRRRHVDPSAARERFVRAQEGGRAGEALP